MARQVAEPADLLRQVAMVTGAGRGLGRAFAEALAAAGATVAVVSRTPADLAETVSRITARGGRAAMFPADATDWQAVQAVVEQIARQYGPIDVLVNAAGIYGELGLFWTTEPARWWHTMEANLLTKVVCARAVLPGMVARRSGRIINVGSSAGTSAGENGSAYACSYAAVLRLTSALAAEGKEHGISVFSISPGSVLTDSFRDAIEGTWGERLPALRDTLHAGRLNPPDRAAQLVTFLASGKADILSGRQVGPSIMEELAQPGRAEQILKDDSYKLALRK